jgi:hypothetical protein
MKGPNMKQEIIDAELEEAMRQLLNATLANSPGRWNRRPEERFVEVLDIIEKTLHRLEALEAHPSGRPSLEVVE